MYKMTWADKRMDDFAAETKRRFDEVDRRFERVDQRFEQVHKDIAGLQVEMSKRFEALNRTLLQVGGGAVVALLGILATQL
jgi:hypothetical protein